MELPAADGGLEARLGARGTIAACRFHIGAAQFEYWQHTQLVIDMVPGGGAGFLTRSRVFEHAEAAEWKADGTPADSG